MSINSGLFKKTSFIFSAIAFASLLFAPIVHAEGGYTWTDQSSAGVRPWSSIASSASGQYLAAAVESDGDVWTSSDYGVTWTDRTSLGAQNWQSITSSADGSHLAAVATNGGQIWTSSDYGVTWTDQEAAGSGDWYGIASSADGSHLTAVQEGGGNIWTSTDYGVTWTDYSNSEVGAGNWYAVSSSASGQYLVAVTEFGYLFTSNDYGVTWVQNSSAPATVWFSDSESSSGQYMAAVVSGGDVWTSNDYGVTWTDQHGSGAKDWWTVSESANGKNLVAGVWFGDIYTSNDYGVTWTDQPSAGSHGWYASASSADGSHIAVVDGDGFGRYSGSGGDIWTANNSSLAFTDTKVITNAVNSNPVEVTVPQGTNITCSSESTDSSEAHQDKGYTYPLGLVNLCFSTLTSSNQVSFIFVTNLHPSQVVARDYNPSTGQYQTVPGAVITQTTYNGQAALKLTFNLSDNGPLDEDLSLGSITDPVGLAEIQSAPNTGFGTPSNYMPALIIVSLALSSDVLLYSLFKLKKSYIKNL